MLSVHPRVCGERVLFEDAAMRDTGSSPRVRGTHVAAPGWLFSNRFIPACAGNAPTSTQRFGSRSVHPRVCGERLASGSTTRASGGSSPRVRGTHPGGVYASGFDRFIPACAGNAKRDDVQGSLATVHPRVCGERRTGISQPPPRCGSSPRVRGTRVVCISRMVQRRFIPACAGNAPRQGPPIWRLTVHPRVCGERGIVVGRARTAVGSSPRVRGTHQRLGRLVLRIRFIPACAGNANRHAAALAK